MVVKIYEFKIITDAGHITYIRAKSKSAAIEAYLEITGMPPDFFKRHCLVKNKGLVGVQDEI